MDDLSESGINLCPLLHDGEWVFVTIADGARASDFHSTVSTFREREGLSAVISKQEADAHGLDYGDFVARWIELTYQSDLGLVGLTATVSTALANSNISCNVIAALFHDHLFVPTQRADEAMSILNRLAFQKKR